MPSHDSNPKAPDSAESGSSLSKTEWSAQDDLIEPREMVRTISIRRGQIIGLGLLGLVIGALSYLVISPFIPVSSSTRLVFAFAGLEKGEYPDHSKFQPDDLRAPEIILEAIRRQGGNLSEHNEAVVRGALTIEGLVSPNIVKERDRLRAAGQNLPPFVPDEYAVSLTLPRKFPLSSRQRELLLNEIVSVYLQNFQQTFAEPPPTFGNAFDTLKRADFYEYEMVLNQDVQNIQAYLTQQLAKAPSFRSASTHLSFSDLLQQVNLFSQIQLNEVLGMIYKNGLSGNRDTAMMKMDYYMRTLDDEESKAVAEEKMVRDLLLQTQERSQNYVLGIKSEASEPRNPSPILDQGLIDSLLVNDAYNFLVHRALEAGMKVREIQAEKAVLIGRRQSMESFLKGPPADQSALLAQVQHSLVVLQKDYSELTASIRKTDADFGRQQYGNAIRFAGGIRTESMIVSLCIFSCVGAAIGLAAGVGLSLIGVNLNSVPRKI